MTFPPSAPRPRKRFRENVMDGTPAGGHLLWSGRGPFPGLCARHRLSQSTRAHPSLFTLYFSLFAAYGSARTSTLSYQVIEPGRSKARCAWPPRGRASNGWARAVWTTAPCRHPRASNHTSRGPRSRLQRFSMSTSMRIPPEVVDSCEAEAVYRRHSSRVGVAVGLGRGEGGGRVGSGGGAVGDAGGRTGTSTQPVETVGSGVGLGRVVGVGDGTAVADGSGRGVASGAGADGGPARRATSPRPAPTMRMTPSPKRLGGRGLRAEESRGGSLPTGRAYPESPGAGDGVRQDPREPALREEPRTSTGRAVIDVVAAVVDIERSMSRISG